MDRGARGSGAAVGSLDGSLRYHDPRRFKPLGTLQLREDQRVRLIIEPIVFYIARFEEGVYVLHAFEKRSRKTPSREIEVARGRLREVLATRRRVR